VPGVKQNSTGGQKDRLAAIVEATGAFSDAVPDVDALLGIIAEHIGRATGDFCAVVLLSPDGRRIEPVAAYHSNPEVLEDASHFLHVPMELDSAGPWKTVLQEKRQESFPSTRTSCPRTWLPTSGATSRSGGCGSRS
jgi:hypothetical protein